MSGNENPPSTPFAIEVHINPPGDNDRETFFGFLRQYNLAQAGDSEYTPLCLLVRDADGMVIAGLDGMTYWGWLFIARLAIQADYRKQGIGTRLLAAAEQEARARGCHNVYLDTFSFQARGFYEKNGYTVFGVLQDYPPGHERYFLQKRL